MRITFILPFAGLSGGVRIVASYAEQLRKRGHDVLVVSVPHSRVSFKQSVKQFLRGRGWPKSAGKMPSHLDNAVVAHKVIDRDRQIRDSDVPSADVIVATWYETADWVAAMSPSKGAKAYFIQQFEANFGMPEEKVASTWQLPLHKIVCSQWLADFACDRFGQTVESVTPNGVDLELFNAPPRGRQAVPTVGLMYGHNAVKGCDISLAALHRIHEKFPNLKLLAYGEQVPIPTLPLPSWCEYTFRPKQETLKDLYARCDVWLCASRSEGFHLPPHEAMACGCPVVSTRVGGPIDMIEHGVNGYLADVESVDGLVDGLTRVLSMDDADWRRMSTAAQETAKEFNWDVATDRFEQALELAMHRSARSDLKASLQVEPRITVRA